MNSEANVTAYEGETQTNSGLVRSIASFFGRGQALKKGKLQELSSEYQTLGNAWRWALKPQNKKMLGNLSKVEVLDLFSRLSYAFDYNGKIEGDKGENIPEVVSSEGLDYLLDRWMEVNPKNRANITYDQLKSEADYASSTITSAMLESKPVYSVRGLGPLGTRFGVLEDKVAPDYNIRVGTIEDPNHFDQYLERLESAIVVASVE